MRTLSDLEAAYQALERQAEQYYGEHDLDRPIGAGRSRKPARRGVLAVAAAVVVGATAAGGSYLWSQNDGHDRAGGASVAMCVALLPAQWRQALAAHPIRVDGQPVLPVQVDASGKVTVQWTVDGTLHVGQVGKGDSVAQIAQLTLPAGHAALSVSADSRSVVVVLFRMPAANSGGSPTDTDDIVVIDRTSGAVSHVLANAPVPSGYAFEGHWGNLVNGVYYWGEMPARGNGAVSDLLISYDIAKRSYAISGRGNSLNSNAVGYFWDSGSFPLIDVPPVHPMIDDPYQTIASDGSALAWSTYENPTMVYWSDTSGAARSFSQHLMHQVSVDGVSGPYVFLSYGEGDDADKVSGNEQVLDTRTGALADTGLVSNSYRDLSGGGILAYWPADVHAPTQVIDLNGLPQIECPRA